MAAAAYCLKSHGRRPVMSPSRAASRRPHAVEPELPFGHRVVLAGEVRPIISVSINKEAGRMKIKKRVMKHTTLLVCVAMIALVLSPLAQVAAKDDRQKQPRYKIAGVQIAEGMLQAPTPDETDDPAVAQLDESLRGKLARDLAPVMVRARQTARVTLEEARAFFGPASPGPAAQEPGVRVIVQTSMRPRAELLATLADRHAQRNSNHPATPRRFKSINAFAAELTAKEIRHLTGRDDVLYISPDRQTLSATADISLQAETGMVNAQAGAASTGTGVGIAILDSG